MRLTMKAAKSVRRHRVHLPAHMLTSVTLKLWPVFLFDWIVNRKTVFFACVAFKKTKKNLHLCVLENKEGSIEHSKSVVEIGKRPLIVMGAAFLAR